MVRRGIAPMKEKQGAIKREDHSGTKGYASKTNNMIEK